MIEIYIMHISGIEKEFIIFCEQGVIIEKTIKGIKKEYSLPDFIKKCVGNATNRYTTVELPEQCHIYSNRLNIYVVKAREYKGIFTQSSIVFEKSGGSFLVIPELLNHMAGYCKEDTENIIQFFSTS